MQTPTISQTQRKSTLSAKKTRIKKVIKSVLATPYDNAYWPQISREDYETLKVVLQNNLPRIKPNKVNIPWNVLKSVPKADRKKFREQYTKNDELQINKRDRKGLNLGVNDVTKLLDNNLISVILISSNVHPRIMVQHIIDESVLYRVPFIIFDDLRTLLSTTCGVSSAVMGISKNIDPHSKLNVIKESVVNIFEKYPPPLNHFNYERSLSTVKNSQRIEDNSQCKNKKSDVTESKDKIEDKINDDELESVMYLKRESKDKRVFVPESSVENVKIHKMEVDSTGFLPFTRIPETTVSKTEKQQVKLNYKSLVVKRLKGDPNRNKRKIASLKKKIGKLG